MSRTLNASIAWSRGLLPTKEARGPAPPTPPSLVVSVPLPAVLGFILGDYTI